MAYKILECPVGEGQKLADMLPFRDFAPSWNTGSSFVEEPPVPIELTWDPENEKETIVSFYELGPVLMKRDLVDALREAGVDNLDTYDVVVHSESGNPDYHGYYAVNIIGSIAAADMENSSIIDESDGLMDVMFESLVIDEEKARDARLFRLAESITTVVIHDDVVEHLLAKGGFGLHFTEPEDFCG